MPREMVVGSIVFEPEPRAANDNAPRERKSHIWEKETDEHYVEPAWCSRRLFQEEQFVGAIYDPACGFGTIVKEACLAGFMAEGRDKIDRGFAADTACFFDYKGRWDNIVTNPPFGAAEAFHEKAMQVAMRKVAFILPVAALNAAWPWMVNSTLRRIWLLTPRPSMPPGHVIAAGEKPQGGRVDYCWCVWQHGYMGAPEVAWLHRDIMVEDMPRRAAA